VRSTQESHANMASGITPFNRMFQHHDAVTRLLNPGTVHGAERLNEMITRQAQIIAFNNDYRMMTFVVIAPLLLLLFMRRPAAKTRTLPTAEEGAH
jgi:DHA2 family multidrug resistance protein